MFVGILHVIAVFIFFNSNSSVCRPSCHVTGDKDDIIYYVQQCGQVLGINPEKDNEAASASGGASTSSSSGPMLPHVAAKKILEHVMRQCVHFKKLNQEAGIKRTGTPATPDPGRQSASSGMMGSPSEPTRKSSGGAEVLTF